MFRFKPFAVTAVCALGLFLTAGCGTDRPDTPVDQPVGVALDAPRVEVIDPGHGDKRVVNYADIGNKQAVTARVSEGFSQDMLRAVAVDGFTAKNMDEHTTVLPLSGETKEATDDEKQAPATRNVFFTVREPSIEGKDAPDVSTADGFQVGWRATDDGAASTLRLAAPQDADDEARAIAEKAVTKLISLPVVFPEEEIGEGAKWTVDSRVTGEATLLQTATYTVQKLDDAAVQLNVDIDQRPSLGALSFGAEAEGTELEGKELEVQSSKSDSTGTLEVDLNKPLPISGNVEVTTKVVYGTDDSELRVVQSSATGIEFSAEDD